MPSMSVLNQDLLCEVRTNDNVWEQVVGTHEHFQILLSFSFAVEFTVMNVESFFSSRNDLNLVMGSFHICKHVFQLNLNN